MSKYFFILFIFIAQNAFSSEIEVIDKACQKSEIDFCKNLEEIKRNTEEKALIFAKILKLESSIGVIGFIINPTFKMDSNNHRLEVSTNKINYSYSF